MRLATTLRDVEMFSRWIVKKEEKTGPSQRLLYLGLEICTVSMKFFIPQKKLEKILSKFREGDSLKSARIPSMP